MKTNVSESSMINYRKDLVFFEKNIFKIYQRSCTLDANLYFNNAIDVFTWSSTDFKFKSAIIQKIII